MIKKIDKNELINSFFDLAAQVEFGDHFVKHNPEHLALLNHVIDKHIAAGCEIFGCYEEESQKPVGFITTVIYNYLHTDKAECEVLELGVVKEFRRKGFGSRLLEYNEKYRDNGIVGSILIKAFAGDSGAVYFYGKNGYVPVSVIPNPQGPGFAGTIVMRKRL